MENVVTLVKGDWYRIEPGAGTETHQPPAYYIALSVWHRALGPEPRDPAPQGKGLAALTESSGIFQHDYAGHDDDERQVRLLRLPSIACGIATILLAFACARHLTRDPWTPVVAAATVAFVPRFVFLSGAINNDNLVNALGALLAFLLVHWVTKPPATRQGKLLGAGAVGLVYGALVLTKISTAPLVIGVVLALGWSVKSWHERCRLVGAAAIATGLVCGWWLARNQIWYGDPLAAEATSEHFRPLRFVVAGEPTNLVTRTLSSIPRMVYRSYFYTSGWNQFVWPYSYYVPYWLLTAGAFLGLVPRRRTPPLSFEVRRAVAVLGVLTLAAFASVWITDLSN